MSVRLLLVAALWALAACGLPGDRPLPDATGEPGEVLVVADSATWAGPVGGALREVLGRSVAPPLDVADFRLRRRDLTEAGYSELRRARSVIFAAALDDDAAVARFLAARLDPDAEERVREGRGAFVVPRRDVWAAGQAVVLAAAGSDALLAEALRRHADTLQALFTAQAEAYLRAQMFARGRQTALEDTLLARHGFTINVQHDYVVAQDTAAPAGLPGRFVRLRRVLSDTWRDVWIYYEDAHAPADTLHVERTTDALLEAFVRGAHGASFVRVDRGRPVHSDSVALAGRTTRRTRGLWRMTEDFMGGPFVRYSFYEPEQRRRYVVFGMVFAPQHALDADKRAFLRQVEVIAQTFRTAGDAPTP